MSPFKKGHNPWANRKKKEKVVADKDKLIAEIEKPDGKIQATFKPNDMLAQIKAMRDTFNRHAIGMEKTLQDMQDSFIVPDCPKCYVLFGWTKGCRCEKV